MRDDGSGRRRYIAWLLVLAFGVRALVALGLLRDMGLVSDAQDYSQMAADLASTFPGEDPYFWPPGTSFLLTPVYWLLGDSLLVSRLVVLALGTVTVFLVVKIADILLKDELAVRITGCLSALYAPALMMAGQTYSQHFIACFLAATAWFFLEYVTNPKWKWLVGTGVGLGSCVLTRPSCVVLVPLIALMLLLWERSSSGGTWRQSVRSPLAIMLVVSILVLPVAYHNHTRGGGFSISTNNERNLFLGNNRYTPNYKTSYLAQRSLDSLEPEVARYILRIVASNSLSDREMMMKETISYVVANPGITLLRTWNRMKSFWGADYIMSRQIQDSYGLGTIALAGLLGLEAGTYFLVMLAVILGLFCWSLSYRDKFLVSGVLVVSVTYSVPYTISFSSGTYHYPVMFLLFPFAGAAVHQLFIEKSLWKLSKRNLALYLAIVVAFVLLQVEYFYHAVKLA